VTIAAAAIIAQAAKRTPREHYPAPYAIIDLWASASS
jgi:hypothetical protein